MLQRLKVRVVQFMRSRLWFLYAPRVIVTYSDARKSPTLFDSTPGDDDRALARARLRRVRKGIFRRNQIMGKNAAVREMLRKAGK